MEISFILVFMKYVFRVVIDIQVSGVRCAKTMVEKEYHKLVPISCEGGPRNSSFIRCSRTHITKPMKTKKHPLVIQRSQVKGFKNTHAFFLSLSLIGTTIDTPDSVYGNVKSTN
jgi:hypothetical protein